MLQNGATDQAVGEVRCGAPLCSHCIDGDKIFLHARLTPLFARPYS
jgi:hypothetical protein